MHFKKNVHFRKKCISGKMHVSKSAYFAFFAAAPRLSGLRVPDWAACLADWLAELCLLTAQLKSGCSDCADWLPG